MRLKLLMLAMVTCASGLNAQSVAFHGGAAPVFSRVSPVVVPRSITAAHPVVNNVSPVRPLSPQTPTSIHLQPISPTQSAAINSAVRNNNYNIYRDYYETYPTQNRPVLNQSEHIARLQGIIQSGQGQTVQNQPGHIGRLQGIIQSGTQPVMVQPGAGLEYNSQTIRQVQTALKRLGYYQGRVDGLFGSGTQSALQDYQLQSSQPATGLLDRRTLSLLGVQAKNATSPRN